MNDLGKIGTNQMLQRQKEATKMITGNERYVCENAESGGKNSELYTLIIFSYFFFFWVGFESVLLNHSFE